MSLNSIVVVGRWRDKRERVRVLVPILLRLVYDIVSLLEKKGLLESKLVFLCLYSKDEPILCEEYQLDTNIEGCLYKYADKYDSSNLNIRLIFMDYDLYAILNTSDIAYASLCDIEICSSYELGSIEEIRLIIEDIIGEFKDNVASIFAGVDAASRPENRVISYYRSDKDLLRDILHYLDLSKRRDLRKIKEFRYLRDYIENGLKSSETLKYIVGEAVRRMRKRVKGVKIEFTNSILVEAESPKLYYENFYIKMADIVEQAIDMSNLRNFIRSELRRKIRNLVMSYVKEYIDSDQVKNNLLKLLEEI